MFFVDLHQHDDDERYLIVFDPLHPERNRVERVSDERFAEFLKKVLDMDIPLSEIEEEYAA